MIPIISDGTLNMFDPYYKWLGIPPELRPPHYYALLGIALFESDPDVIQNAADRQMSHVRSFQNGPHARESQEVLNDLAAARLCLLTAEKKAAYDADLAAALDTAGLPSISASKSGEAAPAVTPRQTADGQAGDALPSTIRTLKAVVGAIAVGVLAIIAALNISRQEPPSDPPDTAGNTAGHDTPNTGTEDPTKEKKVAVKESPPPEVIEGKPGEFPTIEGAVDLIAGIDPVEHSGPQGNWLVSGGTLASPENPSKRYAAVAVPGDVPQEYVLALLVERVRRHDTLAVIIPFGGRQVAISLDGRGGKTSGLDHLSGEGGGPYHENGTTFQGTIFENDLPVVILCTVRKTGITVAVNGRTIIEWTGEPGQVQKPYYWQTIRGHRGIAIGTKDSRYRILRLELAPLS